MTGFAPIETLDDNEKEQKINKSNDKKMWYANAGYMFAGIPEALNFSIIFFMHYSTAFLDFLFGTAMRFIIFPAAAVYGLTKAGFEWYKFHIIRKDVRSTQEDKVVQFLKSLWETLNSLGTTGAVVTGIVGFFTGAAVGMGISITFTFFLSASTLVCAAWTLYFGITAYQAHKKWQALPDNERTEDHPLFKEYSGRLYGAKIHAVFTGVVALLTTGVVLAMVTGIFTAGATVGIIGCLAAVGVTAYLLYQHFKSRPSSNSINTEKTEKNHISLSNTFINDKLDKNPNRNYKNEVTSIAENIIPLDTSTDSSIDSKEINSSEEDNQIDSDESNKKEEDELVSPYRKTKSR